MTREILTIKQVQELLQLSERTIFRLIKNGDLKGFKVGREWRFEPADIDRFIEQQRRKAEEDLHRARAREPEPDAVWPQGQRDEPSTLPHAGPGATHPYYSCEGKPGTSPDGPSLMANE